MFDTKKKSGWNWSWVGIFVVVLGLIGVIQIFRVNPPADRTERGAPTPFLATTGMIIDGALEIPSGGFLSFPMNFNHRINFNGSFTTGETPERLECLIIPAGQFENWRNGVDVQTVVRTGQVPRGRINRTLEPGNYFLILDNRQGTEVKKIIESEFRVE
jgi:hypothetical protein